MFFFVLFVFCLGDSNEWPNHWFCGSAAFVSEILFAFRLCSWQVSCSLQARVWNCLAVACCAVPVIAILWHHFDDPSKRCCFIRTWYWQNRHLLQTQRAPFCVCPLCFLTFELECSYFPVRYCPRGILALGKASGVRVALPNLRITTTIKIWLTQNIGINGPVNIILGNTWFIRHRECCC